MGKFETGVPIKTIAYHGTKDTIQKFELSQDTIGHHTGNNGGAIFFTSEKCVAMQYSIENKYRELENEIGYNQSGKTYDELREQAVLQAHCYEVELNICNPLVLDISRINKDKDLYCTQRGIYNVLDAYSLNYLINMLQNRRYEKDMEYFDSDDEIKVFEKFLDLFEVYNEELDDYREIPHDYDCIIIENCIDSINEDSNYMPSTIYAVLDPSIVKIKRCLKA